MATNACNSQRTKRKPVVVAVQCRIRSLTPPERFRHRIGIALLRITNKYADYFFSWLYALDFSPVAALFVISAMISCRLSTFATLSIPNRWRFADNEPTSGLL